MMNEYLSRCVHSEQGDIQGRLDPKSSWNSVEATDLAAQPLCSQTALIENCLLFQSRLKPDS